MTQAGLRLRGQGSPAVAALPTPVGLLLAVGAVVAEQRAAVDGSIHTLRTPVGLLT